MALDTSLHGLGATLRSVLIERCRIADPISLFERRDLERMGVNGGLFGYTLSKRISSVGR